MPYTKGNWKVEGYCTIVSDALQWKGLPYHIAEVIPHTKDETQANAHLIAAAPDLYEELLDADQAICGLCKLLNPQHENCTSCEDRNSRLKALAKAEGK